MYFMASTAYFIVESDYNRALTYLDKALKVAVDIGAHELINMYKLRYGFIYQALGLYGNAIKHTKPLTRLSPEFRPGRYFFAVLKMLDYHLSIHSSRALDFKREAARLAGSVEVTKFLGLYHELMGNFHFQQREYDDALREYELASDAYCTVRQVDDHLVARMNVARIQLAVGRIGLAAETIEEIKPQLKTIKFGDLQARYDLLELTLLTRRDDRPALDRQIDRCRHIHESIRDVNVAMAADAALFRAYLHIGDRERATACFRSYYSRVKDICSNLATPEDVEQYITNPEFTALLGLFKDMKVKNPGQ
jgi:tetratricopeptide (TPR) repeat protein